MPPNAAQKATDAPVAIVTGAGAGIGRAIAQSLGRLGWRMTLAGRRREPLDDTATLVPAGRAMVLPTDVADTAQCRRLIEETIARFGRLDALINNAGYAVMREIGATDAALLETTFAVNAVGPGMLIACAWPEFVRGRGGVVVNVSSMATQDPFPGLFAYAGAKAALDVFAKSVAKEGAAHNIRAFSVAPGAVETDMLRSFIDRDTLPESATLEPAFVADIVVACVTGARDRENGRTILVPSPAPAG